MYSNAKQPAASAIFTTSEGRGVSDFMVLVVGLMVSMVSGASSPKQPPLLKKPTDEGVKKKWKVLKK